MAYAGEPAPYDFAADPALLPQPLVVGETGIAGWAGFTSM